MGIRKPKLLKSVADIREAIGSARLQAITGADTKAVSNWIAANRIPSRFFYIVGRELHGLGFTAPLSVLGQVEPPRLKRAS
jgi:hypothetical protein